MNTTTEKTIYQMTDAELILAYLDAAEKAAHYSKIKTAAKELLLDKAGTQGTLETADFSLLVKVKKSITLDTKTFYRDFPDAKNAYGKETVSKELIIMTKSSEKTA